MLPKEIAISDVYDWWDAERLKVSKRCAERLKFLKAIAKADVSDLSKSDIFSKDAKQFHAIENRLAAEIEDFTKQLSLG